MNSSERALYFLRKCVKNSFSMCVFDTKSEKTEKEKRGMEDLLERLEAAELLIAFATV